MIKRIAIAAAVMVATVFGFAATVVREAKPASAAVYCSIPWDPCYVRYIVCGPYFYVYAGNGLYYRIDRCQQQLI